MAVIDKNVAYLGTIYPHHALTDLKEIVEAGCTSINLTVNETDWYYYRKSRLAIREAARELGLKVYLNFHGLGAFATVAPAGVYQMTYPDRTQVFNTGKKGELWRNMACPNDPQFVSWLTERVTEIIEYLQPDGIFWDEPRFVGSPNFPDEWSCHCPACKEAFEKRFGRPLPERLDDDVVQFREDSLLKFLQGLLYLGKEVSGGENVLCLMSWDRSDTQSSVSAGWYGVTQWERFIKLDGLDVFSTDPYWIHEKTWDYFLDNATEAIRLSHEHGKRCQIWVQAVWIAPDKYVEISRSLNKAAELGADMLAVWAFRGEPGSNYLDWGGDHDKAWNAVRDAYRNIATG